MFIQIYWQYLSNLVVRNTSIKSIRHRVHSHNVTENGWWKKHFTARLQFKGYIKLIGHVLTLPRHEAYGSPKAFRWSVFASKNNLFLLYFNLTIFCCSPTNLNLLATLTSPCFPPIDVQVVFSPMRVETMNHTIAANYTTSAQRFPVEDNSIF